MARASEHWYATPEAVRLPPQVEVVRGDLTIPRTLDSCLAEIHTVFLVWATPPASVAPDLERIAQHVRRIVFLSAPLKTAHPFLQQPNAAMELAATIERRIEASGLEWTFLRPGMFAANALRWPYLIVPTAPIHEDDIAAIVVRALCEDGHAGAGYVLTGPESLTQFEQVCTIGRAIGRPIRVAEISPEQARREWLTQMPASVVDMLLDAWSAAAGQPAFVTSTVEEITGAPARTFFQWAAEHAGGVPA